MRFSTVFVAALSVGVACAETINVMVGMNESLSYTPSEVTAQVGDVIAFTFVSKNHTVTQSSFADPCTNLSATGLDSGFQPVPTGATTFMQYSFNVTNTSAPMWFYCRQTGHCAQGMVFAVNPTAAKSFAAFQAAAEATGNSTNSTTTTNTTSTSGSTPGASGAPSASGSAGASPSASGSANPPSASGTNAAVSVKTGGALLLSGVGLVAGMLL
jgi:plastocyanin